MNLIENQCGWKKSMRQQGIHKKSMHTGCVSQLVSSECVGISLYKRTRCGLNAYNNFSKVIKMASACGLRAALPWRPLCLVLECQIPEHSLLLLTVHAQKTSQKSFLRQSTVASKVRLTGRIRAGLSFETLTLHQSCSVVPDGEVLLQKPQLLHQVVVAVRGAETVGKLPKVSE
ncbi:Aspartate--tRNA(Asp/Asn) ligase [Trichinella spiralis]|uniref:Aspartate--tRNA(Asp/Asn) ligase n=1 Tax=Trichinella spiralis TaxID=6334 RepID=A0ABR3KCJ2_TRISP